MSESVNHDLQEVPLSQQVPAPVESEVKPGEDAQETSQDEAVPVKAHSLDAKQETAQTKEEQQPAGENDLVVDQDKGPDCLTHQPPTNPTLELKEFLLNKDDEDKQLTKIELKFLEVVKEAKSESFVDPERKSRAPQKPLIQGDAMAGRSVSELKNGESLDEASPPIIEEKPLPEQPAQEAKPEADPKTEKKDEQIEEEERRCSVMPEQGNGGQGVILKESPYSGSDGLLIEESEAVKSEAKHAARCDELEQEAPAPHQHHKIKKD